MMDRIMIAPPIIVSAPKVLLRKQLADEVEEFLRSKRKIEVIQGFTEIKPRPEIGIKPQVKVKTVKLRNFSVPNSTGEIYIKKYAVKNGFKYFVEIDCIPYGRFTDINDAIECRNRECKRLGITLENKK